VLTCARLRTGRWTLPPSQVLIGRPNCPDFPVDLFWLLVLSDLVVFERSGERFPCSSVTSNTTCRSPEDDGAFGGTPGVNQPQPLDPVAASL
jgi:hypothetical protein